MRITGTTRVFLILGDPVAQVRAPEVFNHVFERAGIDAVLVPAQVAPHELDTFVRHALLARNIDGLWLAIPHKTALVPLLDRCDRLGRTAGAVNAARRHADGSLEGALFDGVGFMQALDRFGVATRDRRVLLVGVGGGGVAIATSLAAAGVGRLALFDAVPGRTDVIAARLAQEFGAPVVSADRADPGGYDVVINATPLGLKPGDPLPFDVARVDRDATVVDILMKNQPTPLLRACQERGIAAHPGYEMLVQQIPLYLRFFGIEAEVDLEEVRALLAP